MKNLVQLITYVNRLSQYNSGLGIRQLSHLLNNPLKNIFQGGVHLLPFYYPIDGADAGYDPIDHTSVDPSLGVWEDIKSLSENFDLMGDIIVNHVSSKSKEFQDVLENGKKSEYYNLFLKYSDFFDDNNAQEEIAKIYRPRPGSPFTVKTFNNGDTGIFWTTFTSEQMDINVKDPNGVRYLESLLDLFAQNGLKSIRLDAAGYAIKKIGTSCFMIDETYEFIDEFTRKAKSRGMEVLVEIHSYFQDQIEIAKKVDYVYDFALPPLILHTLYTGNTKGLKSWLEISPRNCVTVLDTHDGIGVIDIGPKGDLPGIIPDQEIDNLVESIHEKSKGQSRKATGEAASNLDLYQVNCTYYDALGRTNRDYIIARAIQFFSPGTPQVYYVGLFAGENDMKLLEETKVGRDINRHYYSEDEILLELEKTVVKDLIKLIKFRNSIPAFNGTFKLDSDSDNSITLRWEMDDHWAELSLDFQTNQFQITSSQEAPLSFDSF